MVLSSIKTSHCLTTNTPTIDSLLGCIPEKSIIDFYGDPQLITLLSYKISAWWHCHKKVGLGIVQEEPVSYDLFTVKTMLRAYRCNEHDFMVARAFRLEDTILLLEKAVKNGIEAILLYNPYAHAPPNPREYWKLTPLNGMLRKLYTKGITIALFNTINKFGVHLPEGGKMHHHITHIIIKLDKTGKKGYRATLIKHYGRREKTLTGPIKEILMVNPLWDGQPLLSEWL